MGTLNNFLSTSNSIMLKRVGLLIIALAFSTLLQGQQSLTKDEQDIQQTVVNFFKSLSNRDSVGLKGFSTTDVTLFEYGRIWNLDTLIRRVVRLNTATDFKRVDSVKFINFSTDKNTAWATYNLYSDITRAGKKVSIHWLESVIFVREKRKWKLKVLHSTMIKRT